MLLPTPHTARHRIHCRMSGGRQLGRGENGAAPRRNSTKGSRPNTVQRSEISVSGLRPYSRPRPLLEDTGGTLRYDEISPGTPADRSAFGERLLDEHGDTNVRPITLESQVRRIVGSHARLSVTPNSLQPTTNLYDAGMNSHAIANLMLALEDEFGIEFPESMLHRSTFQSIVSISSSIHQLLPVATGSGGPV